MVLDKTDQPLADVMIAAVAPGYIELAMTDEQGQFRIEGVPVGYVELTVDGAAFLDGRYPVLQCDVFTLAGVDNTLPRPIYLAELDQSSAGLSGALSVSDTTGDTLKLDAIPGFRLDIAPGSVTFPNASHSGTVSATVVHADKIPMTPNFGQQPRLILTIPPSPVPASIRRPC